MPALISIPDDPREQVVEASDVEDARRAVHNCVEQIVVLCVVGAAGNTFLEFEREIVARVRTLGRWFVALFLAARHEAMVKELEHSLAEDCRVKRVVARTISVFFGQVRYARAYVVRRGVSGGSYPLDVILGLTADRFSAYVIGIAVQLATRMSYAAAALMFDRMVGWAPSTETIEHWVLGLGGRAEAYAEVAAPAANEGIILVIEVDGRCIPTATDSELFKRRAKRDHQRGCACGCQRHRGSQDRERNPRTRRLPGDKSKNGRSVTLVVMYTLERTKDGFLHGPVNKRVFGTLAPRHKAIEWARREATRRGFPPDTDKFVQIVVDGELCLEQGLRRHFPNAMITLDIRHVEEKLWHAGEAFHAPGSDALKDWMGTHRKFLYEGTPRALLNHLEATYDALPHQAHKKRKRLRKLADYIKKRIPMMNYRELLDGDLVIASGVVEGATRYVIGERLDCSGMRWIRERAEALLRLRCLELNGQWESFFQWTHDEWMKKLKHSHAFRIRTNQPMALAEAA